MKKIKKITAALLSMTVCTGTYAACLCTGNAEEALKDDVNGDSIFSIADVVSLQKYLVGLSDIIPESYDINNDGIIDVFDAILMKRAILNTGEEDEEPEEGELTDTMWKAESSNVKLVGRNMTIDGVTWLLHSGSAAEFTVTGRSAELVLSGKNGIDADKDYRPRYAVYVDDEILTDETMDSEEEKITLFTESTSKSHKIKVIQLSEAMNGCIGVSSINVSSTVKNPVKPVPKKNLSIEFIGDSITCGYGVEGLNAYENFKTTTENFTKSYAYLTAQKLDADYSAVCYSGHGIISGYSADGSKNSEQLVPGVYEQCSKSSGYTDKWDFTSSKHDVVVINLGTNDINYVQKEPETRSQEFIDEYISFLKTVRKNNADAYIVCTVGTMGGDDIYELIESAVESYKADTSDERVMSYFSVTQNVQDGCGSDWHPSAATQQNSAYVLADKICGVLGIESDQVGLDVAADAVYDVKVNSANGANEAHFVGYDKSFWINMVSGGNGPEDIVACLSGIGLKNGGEYRLEFDYTTSVEMDFKVSVKGADTYFSDNVSSGNDKQHYSEVFTVNTDDPDSMITFDIGGGTSYNVTLSGIKLTKLA